MGVRELPADLAGAGLSVTAEGDRLVIRPASKRTDPMCAALRAAKPELLVLIRGVAHARSPRPGGRGLTGCRHCQLPRPARTIDAMGLEPARGREAGRAACEA